MTVAVAVSGPETHGEDEYVVAVFASAAGRDADVSGWQLAPDHEFDGDPDRVAADIADLAGASPVVISGEARPVGELRAALRRRGVRATVDR